MNRSRRFLLGGFGPPIFRAESRLYRSHWQYWKKLPRLLSVQNYVLHTNDVDILHRYWTYPHKRCGYLAPLLNVSSLVHTNDVDILHRYWTYPVLGVFFELGDLEAGSRVILALAQRRTSVFLFLTMLTVSQSCNTAPQTAEFRFHGWLQFWGTGDNHFWAF